MGSSQVSKDSRLVSKHNNKTYIVPCFFFCKQYRFWRYFPEWYFILQKDLAYFISLVTNVSDAAEEYKKRVEELTAKGWDQAKFQKILDWYQNTTTRLTSSPSTTTSSSTVANSSEDTFPNGISYSKQHFLIFLSSYQCQWCCRRV